MGHELLHVSQYSNFIGISNARVYKASKNKNFVNMIENHAYQFSNGLAENGFIGPNSPVEPLKKYFGEEYYYSFGYWNYSWTGKLVKPY